MEPLVARNIRVAYGRRTALADFSLTVHSGEVYVLLGRNGAGKSTLVRCLLGLQRPAAGRALLFGRDVWSERARLLAEVGVVHEDPVLPPAMSAGELGAFCARLYPRWDQTGVVDRLRRFGVPSEQPFGQLSRGQKAQVQIALALAMTPRLLLLDDPTLGLDPIARRDVFGELISELADRGTTVFLTTHDLAAAEGLADRVGIVDDGRLLLDETADSLRRRFRRVALPPGETKARERLTELGALHVLERSWGTEAVLANFDEARLAAAWPEAEAPEPAALTLEEVFTAVVEAAGGAR